MDGPQVIGVRHVGELIEMMGGNARYQMPHDLPVGEQPRQPVFDASHPGDMAEVIGQAEAKKALEVAAAGGHHLLMVGPPGSGKTMPGLTSARHHEPVERTRAAGGGLDPLPVRHAAALRHL